MTTEEPLTLPSGEVVNVRGLTGMEVALISKRNAALKDDPDVPGGIAIQIGLMLGHAKIRDAEREGSAWLRSHSAADFTTFIDAIEARSGFGEGAQKSGVAGVDDN